MKVISRVMMMMMMMITSKHTTWKVTYMYLLTYSMEQSSSCESW